MGKFNCPLPIVRNNSYSWDLSYLRTNKKPPLIFICTGDTPEEFPKEDFLDVVAAHEYSHYLLGHTDYRGDTEDEVRKKEADCWFYILLKAKEWHINPDIAHWIISHVERSCDWGGFSLSITGKSARVLPEATIIYAQDDTIPEMYPGWILWLGRMIESPPPEAAKMIAATLRREFQSNSAASVWFRALPQKVHLLTPIHDVWLFLTTSPFKTKALVVTFCRTTAAVPTALKSFTTSCLTDHVVPTAASISRWLKDTSTWLRGNVVVVVGVFMRSAARSISQRSVVIVHRLATAVEFKQSLYIPVSTWCKSECNAVRQALVILRSRYQSNSPTTEIVRSTVNQCRHGYELLNRQCRRCLRNCRQYTICWTVSAVRMLRRAKQKTIRALTFLSQAF